MTTAYPQYPPYPPYPQYAPARPRFVEPNRASRLAWGSYELRYGLGLLALIVGTGLFGLPLHQAFFIMPLRFGFWNTGAYFVAIMIVAAGWVVLPAPWSGRGAAIAMTCGTDLALLVLDQSAVEPNLAKRILWALAVPLLVAAWFVVRQRPPSSMAFVLLTVPGVIDNLVTHGRGWMGWGQGYRFFPEDDMWGSSSPVLAVVWSLALGAVWAARGVASMSKTALQAAPPAPTAGAAMAGAYPAGPRPVGTNTFAILALVFGILGGFFAIVFGHVALSQIKRTGEGGRGMAIAGLVLGYFALVVTILFVAAASLAPIGDPY